MADLSKPSEYEPNQPILLTETDIVKIDGRPVDIPVSVVFQLYPFPTVVIESEMLPDLVRQRGPLKILLRNGAQLNVLLRSLHFDVEKLILVPASQPTNVIDEARPLKEVSFAILNFPAFYGSKDRWINDAEQSIRIPCAIMDTPDWSIEIASVSDIRNVEKSLQRSKGYGLTYNGSVTRSNGATFSVKDVEPLLEALRLFLSVARGATCSLALVRGLDTEGRDSWVRWGAHHSEPGLGHHSAFLRINTDILSDLFPKFWSFFEGKERRKNAILRALDWYLWSNVSAPHIGLVLTFSALEGFSSLVLSEQENNKESTGKFIERALSELQIPLHLPANCDELRTIENTNWKVGPHALADIRNDLVHRGNSLCHVSNEAYQEAWDLGQWYFEMMFLSRFRYQGCYKNRLASGQRTKEAILPVPWACS